MNEEGHQQARTCIATRVKENAKINLEVRELRLQFKAKWVNQWERTRREVGAALLERLTAFEGELVRIRCRAGRVEELEDDEDDVDVVDG